MKKVLLFLVVGVSLMYGEQVNHTNTTVEAQQTELAQIKKEIEQLKREQERTTLLALEQSTDITTKTYLIDEEVKHFLNDFYKSSSSNNTKNTVDFFDDYVVEYFSKGVMTREDIHTDKLSYNDNWTNRSYELKKYKIISDALKARIHYMNIEVEVEWELSSNDEKLNGTSINLLQLMELDGKLSIVSIKEANEV